MDLDDHGHECCWKLAAPEVPPNTDPATLEKIKVAIAESLVSGFRKITIAAAALAMAAA